MLLLLAGAAYGITSKRPEQREMNRQQTEALNTLARAARRQEFKEFWRNKWMSFGWTFTEADLDAHCAKSMPTGW